MAIGKKYTHTHTHIHEHTYTHVHTHIHTHTPHTHTHTHTHREKGCLALTGYKIDENVKGEEFGILLVHVEDPKRNLLVKADDANKKKEWIKIFAAVRSVVFLYICTWHVLVVRAFVLYTHMHTPHLRNTLTCLIHSDAHNSPSHKHTHTHTHTHTAH